METVLSPLPTTVVLHLSLIDTRNLRYHQEDMEEQHRRQSSRAQAAMVRPVAMGVIPMAVNSSHDMALQAMVDLVGQTATIP